MHHYPDKHILIYVHHHGAGHLKRMQQLVPAIQPLATLTFVTCHEEMRKKVQEAFTGCAVYNLPSKWSEDGTYPARTYAQAFEGIGFCQTAAARNEAFCSLLTHNKFDLFISDVSAELTILARQCGVKVVMQRHSGCTWKDPTQVFAYDCAEALYAPYAEKLELPEFAHHNKTYYLGFFGTVTAAPSIDASVITLIHGEERVISAVVASFADTSLKLNVVGGLPNSGLSIPGINFLGPTSDIGGAIHGNVVICSAGNNLLSELSTLNKSLVLIPENRPYDEQAAKAKMMEMTGYGVNLQSEHLEASRLSIIEQVENRLSNSPPMQSLCNKNAPASFADFIGNYL